MDHLIFSVLHSGVVGNYTGLGFSSPSIPNIMKGMALYIVHGAGHNALALQSPSIATREMWEHHGGIMFSGNDLAETIRQVSSIEALLNPNLRTVIDWSKRKSDYEEHEPKYVWGDKELVLDDYQMSESDLPDYIKNNPRKYPNQTFKYTMAEHFGEHKTIANEKLVHWNLNKLFCSSSLF